MRGQAKYTFAMRGNTMVWTFTDPAQTKLELDETVTNARQDVHFKRHGIKQTVGDTMAGKSVTESITAARKVVDGIRRGLTGAIGLDIDALVEAIQSVTGLDRDDVQARVDSADEAKLSEWAGKAAIAAKMAEVEARRKTEAAAKDNTPFKFE